MLKIKDNVDLKELEKFGFKKESWFDNQIVYVKSYEQYNTYFDVTLYDLIQAGLVEKVEEER